MHQAAVLLGVFSLISQLLGLVRDRLLAHTIGPSATLDIYYAAFRIPDLIYLSVASLASITVLMPFLIKELDAGGKAAARKFFNEVLSGFLLLMIVVSTAVFILMPLIAPLIAPGFTAEELHQLVGASRIMLLSPIFMGLSNMLGTVTQLLRKFVVFAISPIFYGAGIICGILFLYPLFGVYGLAMGVAFGALLHLLVQIPTIFAAGFTPKLSAHLERSTLRQVAMLSLPRTLGLSMNSIALLVLMGIGTTLGEGSISIFNLAFNLETTPIGIIGISYAVASFPLLSETFSRGKIKEWQRCILDTVRQIIFWSLPITALMIVLRAQIVRITLGSGAFSWSDTKLTAAALIGQNLVLVLVRAYYSAHNTRTPLVINTFSSLVMIGGAFGLVRLFQNNLDFRYFVESLLRVENTPGTVVLMLPLAYATGILLNALLHWIDLRRNYLTDIKGIRRTSFESTTAAVGIGLVSYIMLNVFARVFNLETFWGVFGQGILAGVVGIIAGIAILALLGSVQLSELFAALKRKFWKVDLVTSEPLPEKE
jgi:putative peptidoglycan lipid II flippase